MTEAYNMDCMEYMRSLPDKAFDLAVVDPPYGIGITGKNRGGGVHALEAPSHSAVKAKVYGPSARMLSKQNFTPCSTTAPRRTRTISGSSPV